MKLNTDIVWREQDENVLVFDPSDGKIYKTNKSGALIWKMLEKSEEEIVEALTEIYDVEKETATETVDEFIEKIKNFGFLED